MFALPLLSTRSKQRNSQFLTIADGYTIKRLKEEANSGQHDLFIHVGDFAYDLHSDNGRRGNVAAHLSYILLCEENLYIMSTALCDFLMGPRFCLFSARFRADTDLHLPRQKINRMNHCQIRERTRLRVKSRICEFKV